MALPHPSLEDTTRAIDGVVFDVGIAGAGQLARMTCLAAWPLGIRVGVLGSRDEPSAPMAAGVIEGHWDDADDVAALGRASKVVTLENEFVEADALAAVEAAGTPVRPSPARLAIVQDKALQKQMLRDAGLPVPPFQIAATAGDLEAIGADLGWPLLLKARTRGYDGYGNATCTSLEQAVIDFERLDAGEGVLAEAFVSFQKELAAMIARNGRGDVAAYPVVETVQRNHVCHEVYAPAPIRTEVRDRAREVALSAAAAAEGLGVTGVEMFMHDDGEVVVNELAPRPHNSGHYTIEACETSQFENHLRGVLDMPLGSPQLRAPAAAMVNLLGTHQAAADPNGPAALAVPGAHLHLYDKAEVRPGRKMGHVTALAGSVEEAVLVARRAADEVGL